MGKAVAIVQSSYIPWKGYFDIINFVDEFIFLDDVQYTRQDWRNRNLIKTASGLRWLTIPVVRHDRLRRTIRETMVSDPGWSVVHWKRITDAYAGTQYFATYGRLFEDLYAPSAERSLCQINRRLTERICAVLGITTPLRCSEDYDLPEGKTERLVWLCRQSGATVYVSGPAAQTYIESNRFETAGIELRYVDYDGYPEYRQRYAPFHHQVTVLDLIFNEGPQSTAYLHTFPDPDGAPPRWARP